MKKLLTIIALAGTLVACNDDTTPGGTGKTDSAGLSTPTVTGTPGDSSSMKHNTDGMGDTTGSTGTTGNSMGGNGTGTKDPAAQKSGH